MAISKIRITNTVCIVCVCVRMCVCVCLRAHMYVHTYLLSRCVYHDFLVGLGLCDNRKCYIMIMQLIIMIITIIKIGKLHLDKLC